jgi:uncharacterized protein (TIGR00299 family) protein
MKKIAYLECPTGIAGDMCLGALVSAGVPLEYISEKLSRLGISQEYQLRAELVYRNGQQATKVYVDLTTPVVSATPAPIGVSADEWLEPPTFDPHSHTHEPASEDTNGHPHSSSAHSAARHLPEIEQMIGAAKLPARAQAWSLAVFRTLAEAEGAVHGIDPEQVHFHEVGATDAIVDIVGTCLGLDWLGIDELYCSALPLGGGTVMSAHGRLPVPAPAVLKLIEQRGCPVYHNGIEKELVTPTGAALAVTLAAGFMPPPPMSLYCVGLGAGTRDLAIPNILRLWIGKKLKKKQIKAKKKKHNLAIFSHLIPAETLEYASASSEVTEISKHSSAGSEATETPEHSSSSSEPTPASHPNQQETITVLETQIDDLNPQAIGYIFEALFAVGVLDVFTQPVGMKKCRPGILLTVICYPQQQAECEAVIFRETTTLGIRCSTQQRVILDRQWVSVQTPWGEVTLKIAKAGDRVVNVQPEYEDCAALARKHHQSWREVHRIALQAYYTHQK